MSEPAKRPVGRPRKYAPTDPRCTRCGLPPLPGESRCLACKKYGNAVNRARRARMTPAERDAEAARKRRERDAARLAG